MMSQEESLKLESLVIKYRPKEVLKELSYICILNAYDKWALKISKLVHK